MIKKLSILLSVFVLAFVVVSSANAAVLKNAYLRLSSADTAATGVQQTFFFNMPANTIGGVKFQYCTTASSTCTNSLGANDLQSAAIATVTGAGAYGTDAANWAVTGITIPDLLLARHAGAAGSANGNWTFVLTGLVNPVYATCGGTDNQTSTDTQGTCYVRITTYSDTANGTAADSTVVSMTIIRNVTITATVDPNFTMTIAPVAGTVTPTGWTLATTAAQTTTTISVPFGNLTPGVVERMAHIVTISTNASSGYSVSARMLANMTGTAYGSDIDALNNGAALNTPAAWSSPNGIADGQDSGWLGIGTNDTGAPGYAADQFYPLGTTAQTVINSSTSANSDANYLVYGIQVNNYQRADSYTGTLRLNALPVY